MPACIHRIGNAKDWHMPEINYGLLLSGTIKCGLTGGLVFDKNCSSCIDREEPTESDSLMTEVEK